MQCKTSIYYTSCPLLHACTTCIVVIARSKYLRIRTIRVANCLGNECFQKFFALLCAREKGEIISSYRLRDEARKKKGKTLYRVRQTFGYDLFSGNERTNQNVALSPSSFPENHYTILIPFLYSLFIYPPNYIHVLQENH